MRALVSDVAAYLKDVFWEGQKVLLVFDALGVLLFLSPAFSAWLAANAIVTRTVGLLILLISYFAANVALYRRYARSDLLTEDSLLLYSHRGGRGNAVKMVYLGSRTAKDLLVMVRYVSDSRGEQNLTIEEFYPKEDDEMKHRPHKHDLLKPEEIVYFRLPWRKDTSTGTLRVSVSFTDTKYPTTVRMSQEFQLTDGDLAELGEFGWA